MEENSDRELQEEGSYEYIAENNNEDYLTDQAVMKIKQYEREYKENSKRYCASAAST